MFKRTRERHHGYWSTARALSILLFSEFSGPYARLSLNFCVHIFIFHIVMMTNFWYFTERPRRFNAVSNQDPIPQAVKSLRCRLWHISRVPITPLTQVVLNLNLTFPQKFLLLERTEGTPKGRFAFAQYTKLRRLSAASVSVEEGRMVTEKWDEGFEGGVGDRDGGIRFERQSGRWSVSGPWPGHCSDRIWIVGAADELIICVRL
ncbi:hypothetical protein U1Q18_025141 [Sarracenia purpurea var. burkii]